jgi:hypothetical protein
VTTTVQKQILINARALIADPAHWSSGRLATAADGGQVDPCDPSATRWCAVGAIHRAAYDLVGDRDQAARIARDVAKSICPRRWFLRGVAAINDIRGHAAIRPQPSCEERGRPRCAAGWKKHGYRLNRKSSGLLGGARPGAPYGLLSSLLDHTAVFMLVRAGCRAQNIDPEGHAAC